MAQLLVVDDEAAIRELLRILLQGEGHDVREAKDGASALEHVLHAMPDVILLDVAMPGMNGWRFLEELYARGLRNRTRVIMISGHADRGLGADQLRVGLPSHFIAKPFHPQTIIDAVDDALAHTPEELLERRDRSHTLARLLNQIDQLIV